MGFILKDMDAEVLPIKMVYWLYDCNWSSTKLTSAHRIFFVMSCLN